MGEAHTIIGKVWAVCLTVLRGIEGDDAPMQDDDDMPPVAEHPEDAKAAEFGRTIEC